MAVKLYSTGCPKCQVLEKKLVAQGIDFEIVKDFNHQPFVDMGITYMPVLEITDNGTTEYREFTDAVKWVSSQGVK